MKKPLFSVLLATLTALSLAQNKSVSLLKENTVNLELTRSGVDIESLIHEKREINDSKYVEDYTISVFFNNFSTISSLKGNTYNANGRNVSYITQFDAVVKDAEEENIFHSDRKVMFFRLGNVTDKSTIDYSYKITYKNPRLLPGFYFQNTMENKNVVLNIICDEGIEIGYKLYGEHTDKIKFSTSKRGKKTEYHWEAADMPAFEPEGSMPAAMEYIPHIIYYIKSYTKDGNKVTLLETPECLFQWYAELTADINRKDLSGIKQKTEELIKGKETTIEKARAIYNWVQYNLNYIAFEYEMGGFIPRDAADVFEKKYGDCKDMANLLNTMLCMAGINSGLTWTGTKDKPYSYHDLPSPLVDNHMIVSFLDNNTRYYLDATDKYCPFGLPSQFTQGKEALVKLQNNEFSIETIPVPSADHSTTRLRFDMSIDGAVLNGTVGMQLTGYTKDRFLNVLARKTEKEEDIWKAILNGSNNKIDASIVNSQKNTYDSVPTSASYKISLDNWLKTLNNNLILKPVLLFPLRNMNIEIGKREYPVDLECNEVFDYEYNYELPEGYHIEHLPENINLSNPLADFLLEYKTQDNKLTVRQKVATKKLIISRSEFQEWSDFIKEINKNYNQSVLLAK